MYLFNQVIDVVALTSQRITGILFIGLEFVIFLALYLLILITLNFWDEYDKGLFREKFPASRYLFGK